MAPLTPLLFALMFQVAGAAPAEPAPPPADGAVAPAPDKVHPFVRPEPGPRPTLGDRLRLGPPRLRFVPTGSVGSLRGTFEKDSGPGGIGGNAVDLRKDLGLTGPFFSTGLGVEFEPSDVFRFRASVETGETAGDETLASAFTHDGRGFQVGEHVRSRFAMTVYDLEARLARRHSEASTFGFFGGLRAVEVRTVIQGDRAGRIGDATGGGWMRGGMFYQRTFPHGFSAEAAGALGLDFGMLDTRNKLVTGGEIELRLGVRWTLPGRGSVSLGYRYLLLGLWQSRLRAEENAETTREEIGLSVAIQV